MVVRPPYEPLLLPEGTLSGAAAAAAAAAAADSATSTTPST